MIKHLTQLTKIFVVWLIVMLPFLHMQPAQAGAVIPGTWECWDDGNGNPCRYDFYGVDMVSSSDGWAIGASGIIRRYNGTQWVDFASPTKTWLTAIDMVSGSSGWIVGNQGTILHWDGTAWVYQSSPTIQNLNDVKMLSDTDGWAVGGNYYQRIILHWNGNAWSEVTTPLGSGLYAISIISATNAWAVGYDESTVLHWDGSQWQAFPTSYATNNSSLSDITMLSATDGWAVGSDGMILHWNGTAWLSVTPVYYEDLTSIFMLSFDNGWAVGFHNTLLHWDGSQWANVTNTYGMMSPSSLQDIQMLSATNGWTVGDYGDMWHWDGNTWQRLNRPVSVLASVTMSGRNNGFAVGGWPDVVALQWNGQNWNSTSTSADGQSISPVDGNIVHGAGGLSFYDVDTISPVSAWAAGTEQPMRWDGQQWVESSLPVENYYYLTAVDMLSDSDVWIVSGGEYSNGGYINGDIFRWNGVAWNLVAMVPTSGLSDIKMLNANDGWVIGKNGTILRWNGSSWINIASPVNTNLTAVDVISSNFAIIVGEEGVIAQWNGTNWVNMSSPVTGEIASVDILSPTDIWATSGSKILHWDGTSWKDVWTLPSGYYLRSIHMVDAYEGWVVGSGGIILHYLAPRPALTLNHSSGAPGSYFVATGVNFPANSLIPIIVNEHELGNVTTDSGGNLKVILSTTGADKGYYQVKAAANLPMTLMAWFSLDPNQPVQPQNESGTVMAIPSGTAYQMAYLPTLRR